MTRSQNNPLAETTKPKIFLTPDCKCVQRELLDLAAALGSAPLAKYAALTPTFLEAVREFRQHLREHAADVESPGGVFDHLALSAPSLDSEVENLAEEHFELDRFLGKLELELEAFDPADDIAAEAIRHYASGLAEMTHCHQRRGCMVAQRAGLSGDGTRGN